MTHSPDAFVQYIIRLPQRAHQATQPAPTLLRPGQPSTPPPRSLLSILHQAQPSETRSYYLLLLLSKIVYHAPRLVNCFPPGNAIPATNIAKEWIRQGNAHLWSYSTNTSRFFSKCRENLLRTIKKRPVHVFIHGETK